MCVCFSSLCLEQKHKKRTAPFWVKYESHFFLLHSESQYRITILEQYVSPYYYFALRIVIRSGGSILLSKKQDTQGEMLRETSKQGKYSNRKFLTVECKCQHKQSEILYISAISGPKKNQYGVSNIRQKYIRISQNINTDAPLPV